MQPLTPEAARHLRLPLLSRFSPSTLRQFVAANPGRSFFIPGSNDYIIGGLWRRRADIGEVVELSRGSRREELLDRLVERFRDEAAQLIVLDYDQWSNESYFFAKHGFIVVEQIVEYLRRGCGVDSLESSLTIQPCRSSDQPELLKIERESFPWLWWNSPEELALYVGMPGVQIYGGWLNGDLVGYAGWTVRGSDGHLDRLAVRSSLQGQHLGAALLVDTLQRMGQLGVREVALTTQEDNFRSQALYHRYGFQRGRWSYEIHGLWLR